MVVEKAVKMAEMMEVLAGSLKVCDLSIYQLPILEQQGSIELFSRYSPSQHR